MKCKLKLRVLFWPTAVWFIYNFIITSIVSEIWLKWTVFNSLLRRFTKKLHTFVWPSPLHTQSRWPGCNCHIAYTWPSCSSSFSVCGSVRHVMHFVVCMSFRCCQTNPLRSLHTWRRVSDCTVSHTNDEKHLIPASCRASFSSRSSEDMVPVEEALGSLRLPWASERRHMTNLFTDGTATS